MTPNAFPKNFIAATEEYCDFNREVNAPYFRKTFLFRKGQTAKIRICGLGFYELFVNGENVTHGKLAPYISNPDQALYYDDYDITAHLREGKNAIGVWLGNGMQNAFGGALWDFDKAAFRSAPKFALAFWADDKLLFESDESFLTKSSPITFDDLRAGEHYDARLETPRWAEVELDESDWRHALKARTPSGTARRKIAEPVRVFEHISPLSVVKTPKGGYLYDFGINYTGVCTLRVRGKRGQTLRLTHGEVVLNGELDQRNIVCGNVNVHDGYEQCDRYTLKGEGEEVYTPRFTYHGFRYVYVEGLEEEQATLDLLTFDVMHSDVRTRGSFRCSDEIANRIQESVVRSDLSNLFYIPTDCPHREKNGWTGDVALSAEQMLLNLDVKKTFEDWLFSVCRAQNEAGAIPGIVPTGGWGFAWGAGPNWDDALLETTYQVYRYSGDEKVVQENLPAIERYLRYMQTKINAEGLTAYGLEDWAQPNFTGTYRTPLEVTDTLKCADMCDKAAALAAVVGNVELQTYASALAKGLRASFTKKYIKDGKCTVAEQTAIACALYYHASEKDEESLRRQLLEVIRRDGGTFTTGVLGARVLFRTLSDMGECDLAYTLITQDKFPSYGYHVRRGAHTLFECFHPLKEGVMQRENGLPVDSLNHHFWGDVSAWFIAYVVGIKVNPTFFEPNSVEISPCFPSQLSFAEGSFEHENGDVRCRWEHTDEGIRLRVTLPKGLRTTLRLPQGYVCDGELYSGENALLVRKA